MRLSNFIVQKEEEKMRAVLHEGVLIGKRKPTGLVIFLFQLNNFYVETFCDIKTKEVIEYRVFEHTRLLEPYLQSICIEDLFEN